MNSKATGILCGIIAAICYGTNPLGALYLSSVGVNVHTVVFFRYAIAIVGLIILMLFKREPLKINLVELVIVTVLGILFGLSSLTLYDSFNYMEAGIASTLLFVYPIMVAVIMMIFFKEKPTIMTFLSLALAIGGIALLYRGGDGVTLNGWGVTLVMISSLTYAIYIVMVNRVNLKMSSFKLTLYVLIFGMLPIVISSFFGGEATHIQMLHGTMQWGYAAMLGIMPTLISLVTMAIAIRLVGSTPAAIMGALEPVTAVVIGVTIFGESLSTRLVIGILLILSAVILIIIGKKK